MGVNPVAIFGYGLQVTSESFPWNDEAFEKYGCDFLEWASQATGYKEPGYILNAEIEEREEFSKLLPINLFSLSNVSRRYEFLVLTGYYWVNDRDKPKQVLFPVEANFEQARQRAIDFCEHHGINFNVANWLICAMIET
ncbi:MAG: hypothetical protein WAQ98_23685 [Blastocatellia bacterium]